MPLIFACLQSLSTHTFFISLTVCFPRLCGLSYRIICNTTNFLYFLLDFCALGQGTRVPRENISTRVGSPNIHHTTYLGICRTRKRTFFTNQEGRKEKQRIKREGSWEPCSQTETAVVLPRHTCHVPLLHRTESG